MSLPIDALTVEVYLHLTTNRRLLLKQDRHFTRLFCAHVERQMGAMKPQRRKILILTAMGYKPKEIAKIAKISERTAVRHVAQTRRAA